MKPVMGPQSQMNEENACSIPSVCKKNKKHKSGTNSQCEIKKSFWSQQIKFKPIIKIQSINKAQQLQLVTNDRKKIKYTKNNENSAWISPLRHCQIYKFNQLIKHPFN